MRRPLAILFLACAALTACARSVAIQSGQPGRNFSVEISNQTGVAMVVTYDDGRGDALLGNVAAGATERFIIASPATPSVSIRGNATTGSRIAGPYTVTLTTQATARVTLR